MYAEPNDDLDFARRIAALIDDPDLRMRMGAVGAGRVADGLAWPHQAAALVTAYDEMLANDRKADR